MSNNNDVRVWEENDPYLPAGLRASLNRFNAMSDDEKQAHQKKLRDDMEREAKLYAAMSDVERAEYRRIKSAEWVAQTTWDE